MTNKSTQNQSKTIVLSGGGTAGHIYPAIAVADELKTRGYNIVYAGTPQGVESEIVPKSGYDFKGFNVSGFDRQKPWTAISAVYRLYRAKKEALTWLNKIQPVCCVGFGGYVSVPVMEAARNLKIKTCIHEQNSHMGIANEECAKFADAICLTYSEASAKLKDRSKVAITGNPVRSEILSATRVEGRQYLGIDEDKLVLLVFGGSLGAVHLNEAFLSFTKELLEEFQNLEIVHISGKKDFENCKAKAEKLPNSLKCRYHLVDYCTEMPKVMAATDCIVSRAGATSLAEISARKIPAILVPFPYATANHQEKNAKSYVEAGAAYMIKDAEMDSPEFKEKCIEILSSGEVRSDMSNAAKNFKTADAAEEVADAIESLIK